jgi:hypothetical protein
MEAMVLCELPGGRDDAREQLLAHVDRLSLAGSAREIFAGRDREEGGVVVAILAFQALDDAERFLEAVARELPDSAALRLLRPADGWQARPASLLFP